MVRKNFYLTEGQTEALKAFTGLTVSEHIRRAIDEYIQKQRTLSATVSPSKPLQEVHHG